jgi:hypothetical protein
MTAKEEGNMDRERSIHKLGEQKSFELRRPVLEAVSSLRDCWRLSDDKKSLELFMPLSNFSPGQRAALEFAIDPWCMSENIFQSLDQPARQELAKAIYVLFGPGGPVDRP